MTMATPRPTPTLDDVALVIANYSRRLRTAEPWNAGAFIVVNAVIGFAWFCLLIVLLIAGGALSIILIGLPMLWATMRLWVKGARWERERLHRVFGIEILPPHRVTQASSWRGGIKARVTDLAVWRDLSYLLLLFPVGLLELSVVTLAAFLPVALILSPTYFWLGGIDIYGWNIESMLEALFASLIGVVLLPLALALFVGVARAHVEFARWMLGPSSGALQERVDVLTKSRAGVMEAMLGERRRIERDLHDGAQQRIVALAMDLGMAKEKLDSDPVVARQLVESAHDEAKRVLVELRELVRGIHPAVLTDRGLDAAISAVAGRSPVPVTVNVRLKERLPEPVEATAYFVVVEALANVAKHSRATRAKVTVTRHKDRLSVEVQDDGAGGANPILGTGLTGLGERLAALDGRLTVISPANGGTVVRADLPCGP